MPPLELPAEKGSNPWISVIMPINSCRATIKRALDGLHRQMVPDRCEIIFICDTIRDDTLEIIDAHPLVLLWDIVKIDQPGRGLAAAYNTGWRAARSRYILNMHPDCYPKDNDAMLRMAALLENEKALAVQPLVDIPQNDWEVMSFWDRVTSAQFRHAKPSHALLGKFDLIRRDALERIGGFDEARFYSAGEDADMIMRIWAAGQLASSDVVVIHAHQHPLSSQFISALRKHAQIGEGSGALLRKYWHTPDFWHRAWLIVGLNLLKLALLIGIFIPPLSLYAVLLMLLLAGYYGRWAMLTRDWRVPLIPITVSVMFSIFAVFMVRGFILGRQSFHYSKIF
jgi:GT2 family glycosyltransferase